MIADADVDVQEFEFKDDESASSLRVNNYVNRGQI